MSLMGARAKLGLQNRHVGLDRPNRTYQTRMEKQFGVFRKQKKSDRVSCSIISIISVLCFSYTAYRASGGWWIGERLFAIALLRALLRRWSVCAAPILSD